MNKALLGKIGWSLLHDKDSLWARVLRSKFKVGDVHDASWLRVKSNWSDTWRSITVGLREVVIPGLSWILGDGEEIRVWTDKWLLNTPLTETTGAILPNNYAVLRASDVWQQGIGWNRTILVQCLSEDTRLRLNAVVLDKFTGAKDRLSWGESQDGQFTVSSAYAF